MQLEICGLLASAILGGFGWCVRKIDANEKRLDHIELLISREYTNKKDFIREVDRFYDTWNRELDRISTKLECSTK